MFCQPANPRELFEEFWHTWVDDFELQGKQQKMNLNDSQFKTMLLLDPEMRLQSFEKELQDFGLPKPSVEDMCQVRSIANIEAVIIPEEKDYDVEQLVKSVQESTSTFTKEQQQIFKDILAAVKRGEQLLAFVDARGGCGKTYLLNRVLSAV